jgi:hypothetical protein
VSELARAGSDFACLKTEIVASNPTRVMQVYVCLVCGLCPTNRQRPFVGVIPPPRNSTDYVWDQETEKAATAPQRVLGPLMMVRWRTSILLLLILLLLLIIIINTVLVTNRPPL